MVTATQGLTYEDLIKLPDDGTRYELLGGGIVMAAAPDEDHQEIIWRLESPLQGLVRAGRLGRVVQAPFDVRLSEHDVVEPDLIYVSNERLGIMRGTYAGGAPDLVVEVLSPSTRKRDEGDKLALYAAAGVREYWIADAPASGFRALALGPEGVRLLPQDGDLVRSRVLPGLTIDVAALFADLPSVGGFGPGLVGSEG